MGLNKIVASQMQAGFCQANVNEQEHKAFLNMAHSKNQLPEDLKHAWTQGPNFETFQKISAKIVNNILPMGQEDSPLEQSAKVMHALMDFVTDFFSTINSEQSRVVADLVCSMLKEYCRLIKSNQELSELETAGSEMLVTFKMFCEKMNGVTKLSEFLDFMKKQFKEILSVESVPELGRFKSGIDTIIDRFITELHVSLFFIEKKPLFDFISPMQPIPDESGPRFLTKYQAENKDSGVKFNAEDNKDSGIRKVTGDLGLRVGSKKRRRVASLT